MLVSVITIVVMIKNGQVDTLEQESMESTSPESMSKELNDFNQKCKLAILTLDHLTAIR